VRTLADISKRHRCPIIFFYLCEAHAWDSWPLSPNAPKNHANLGERVAAASSFLSRWPSFAQLLHSTYVDEMDNATTIALGLWPERLLLLKHGAVSWASTFSDDVSSKLVQQLQQASQQVFA